MELNNIIPGCKISFIRNPEEYTVRACNSRFIICTYMKKFTVHYTIIDILLKVRGPHNFTFNRYDFSRKYFIDKCLNDLDNEFSGVTISKRHTLPLDIKTITQPKEE